MAKESRVKKSLLNARVNLICYMISLVVAFFTRRVFLEQLGTEFIGLTGTLQSLLGFLNLAELGIGGAIGYVLYKPVSEDNHDKINEIISLFGYLYRYIGFIILGFGIILSLFIPLIFPNTSFSLGVIYFGFYAYLTSSLIGYFVNYRTALLGADQRNYIVTGYFQLTTTLKVIIQIILALVVCNFYLYFAIELIFGIINSIILNKKINQTYPWLESEIKLGKGLLKKYPDVAKYVKQLFIHKIAGFVQSQISPVFIYSFVSLPMVALYGNYTIITQRVQSLIGSLLGSTSAGIGSLIAEGDSDKSMKVYAEMFSIQALIAGFIASAIFVLINPFIAVWLGREYPLDMSIVLLIVLQFFMEQLRGTTEQFKFGFGLFADTWAPIAEAVIYVISAAVGGYFLGLKGVLLGPIVSLLLIVHIWKPYYLFKEGFHKSVVIYIKIFFQHIIPIAISFVISYILVGFILPEAYMYSGWGQWILGACLFSSLMLTLSCILLYVSSSGMRAFVHRFVKKRQWLNRE